MSNKQAASSKRNLRPVDSQAPTTTAEKPKRERKPRAPTSFADELRGIAATHRKKLGTLVDAEAKLEAKLAEVRAQREAAEGPLREVEAMLERYPALPLEQSAAEPAEASPPAWSDAAAEGEVSP